MHRFITALEQTFVAALLERLHENRSYWLLCWRGFTRADVTGCSAEEASREQTLLTALLERLHKRKLPTHLKDDHCTKSRGIERILVGKGHERGDDMGGRREDSGGGGQRWGEDKGGERLRWREVKAWRGYSRGEGSGGGRTGVERLQRRGDGAVGRGRGWERAAVERGQGCKESSSRKTA